MALSNTQVWSLPDLLRTQSGWCESFHEETSSHNANSGCHPFAPQNRTRVERFESRRDESYLERAEARCLGVWYVVHVRGYSNESFNLCYQQITRISYDWQKYSNTGTNMTLLFRTAGFTVVTGTWYSSAGVRENITLWSHVTFFCVSYVTRMITTNVTHLKINTRMNTRR